MRPLDNQTAYWNSAAQSASFTHPVDFPLLSALISKNSSILDYGCGYGRTCQALAEKGFLNVLGVDTSSELVARGRRTWPDLELQVLEKPGLEGENRRFDLVLLFAVLTCIPSDEGQRHLISGIKSVLKPGGLLYVSDYPLQQDLRRQKRYEQFYRKFGTYGVFELPDGGVFRHHSQDWLDGLFEDFAIVSRKDLAITTLMGNQARAFQYVGKLL